MKKFLLLILAMSVMTITAACGSDSDGDSDSDSDKKGDDQAQTEEQAGQEISISDDEKVAKGDVVAQVNDKKLKGDQYNNIYAQTKAAMNMDGNDVSDKNQIKEQAMDVLVQQELIKQDAEDKGVDVSDDDVDEEFEKMKSEDEEQFQAALDQLKLSEEGYRDQLAFQMTLDKYMDQEFSETDVSDEDAKEYYDQLKEQNGDEQGGNIPEFDDIKENIKAQMEQEQQGKQLQDKVDQLKKKADVKNMI